MQAPAVSGAQLYAELCEAAKNEQHQQEELQKRQLYSNSDRRIGRGTPQPQPSGGGQVHRNTPQEHKTLLYL